MKKTVKIIKAILEIILFLLIFLLLLFILRQWTKITARDVYREMMTGNQKTEMILKEKNRIVEI